MELDFPDWACVDIGEGVSDRAGHEVPELDAPVTAGGHQVRACWVEVNS